MIGLLLLRRLSLRFVLLAIVVVFLCVAIPLRRAYAAHEEPVSPIERFEHVVLRLKGAEQAVEKRFLSEKLRLHFYGYLEGSYTQNFNNPSNRINQLRVFDVNSNEARPNLAQFVLGRDAKYGDAWTERFGFKGEIQRRTGFGLYWRGERQHMGRFSGVAFNTSLPSARASTFSSARSTASLATR